MKIELSKSFIVKMQKRVQRYRFEVGVLEEKPHRLAKRGERGQGGKDVLSKYAGGPVRQATRVPSGHSISEVGKQLRERTGVNYLTEPFKSRTNKDINQFATAFLRGAFGNWGSSQRRILNLLQAIVRNPILRGDYGHNSILTQKIKGFDRSMIDTGQLFKAIKARVSRRV